MINIFCFLFGHKINLITCPYTKNTYKTCERCSKKKHTEMSFH